MSSRWIGWSAVVCAAATAAYAAAAVAHAGPSRRPGPRVAVAKDPPAAPPSMASIAPPPAAERSAPRGKPRTRPKKAKAARDAAAELARLTDDPLLAGGDRIDGHGVRGMVAFTFDDGPNPETTPHVIEALQKYDVPATFFIVTRRLVGRLAAQNRAMLARELEGGFLVGSHSVSHTNMKTLSTRALRREVDQSLRVLSMQASRPIGLFRAPYGALDDRGHALLRKRGLTEVKWSIDTIDWGERDGEQLRTRALATILRQEGGVVLMHDVKEVTALSLAQLLDDLEAANCQRLADKKDPVLPVSLHYWLRDNGKPRLVPDDVKQRTQAYRDALPDRCAARANPDAPTDEPPAPPAAAPRVAKAEPPAAAPPRAPKHGRARRHRR